MGACSSPKGLFDTLNPAWEGAKRASAAAIEPARTRLSPATTVKRQTSGEGRCLLVCLLAWDMYTCSVVEASPCGNPVWGTGNSVEISCSNWVGILIIPFLYLRSQVEALPSEQELPHQQTSVGADLSRPSPIYRHRTTPEDAFQVLLSTDLDQNGHCLLWMFIQIEKAVDQRCSTLWLYSNRRSCLLLYEFTGFSRYC